MADYPDFEGGKVGIWLIPGWAARLGLDKIVSGSAEVAGFEGSDETDYTVPADLTYYITSVAWGCAASSASDANNNQMSDCTILIDDVIEAYAGGGNGGGSTILPKPLVVAAGEKVTLRVRCLANHACGLCGSIMGYEV